MRNTHGSMSIYFKQKLTFSARSTPVPPVLSLSMGLSSLSTGLLSH